MLGLEPQVLDAVKIEHVYVSAGHNFFGRHGMDPLAHPAVAVAEAECIAGRGIRGDRFFERPPDHKGQITFFSMEVYEALCRELRVEPPPSALRRNIFVRGVELNELIGQAFLLQGVEFEGVEHCKPCYWMNRAIAPGAEAFLQGRGGLRARILQDGVLRTSP